MKVKGVCTPKGCLTLKELTYKDIDFRIPKT